jgi:hypothetical protein
MAVLIALAAIAENLIEYALMSEASRNIPDPEDLSASSRPSTSYVGCFPLPSRQPSEVSGAAKQGSPAPSPCFPPPSR